MRRTARSRARPRRTARSRARASAPREEARRKAGSGGEGVRGRGRDSLAAPLISSCSPLARCGPAPALPSRLSSPQKFQQALKAQTRVTNHAGPRLQSPSQDFSGRKGQVFSERGGGNCPDEELWRTPGLQHASLPPEQRDRPWGDLCRARCC